MKYLILRKEKSVEEVINSAYKSLTASARKRARTALLEMNPALTDFSTLERGSVIRVPELFPKSKNNKKNQVDPIQRVVSQQAGNLKQYEHQLLKSYEQLEEKQAKVPEVLKAAAKQISGSPQAAKTATALRAHIKKVRVSNTKRRDQQLKALASIQKSLAAIERQ